MAVVMVDNKREVSEAELEVIINEVLGGDVKGRSELTAYCKRSIQEIDPDKDRLLFMAICFYEGFLAADKCRV